MHRHLSSPCHKAVLVGVLTPMQWVGERALFNTKSATVTCHDKQKLIHSHATVIEPALTIAGDEVLYAVRRVRSRTLRHLTADHNALVTNHPSAHVVATPLCHLTHHIGYVRSVSLALPSGTNKIAEVRAGNHRFVCRVLQSVRSTNISKTHYIFAIRCRQLICGATSLNLHTQGPSRNGGRMIT